MAVVTKDCDGWVDQERPDSQTKHFVASVIILKDDYKILKFIYFSQSQSGKIQEKKREKSLKFTFEVTEILIHLQKPEKATDQSMKIWEHLNQPSERG